MPEKLHFRLSDLSAYRSELMGWSILWVMMLHFRFITLKPLGFIAQYGFAGVEIFMFVSGLGLYYSLEKDHRLVPFYTKRLKRIFPVYYLVGIFASLLLFSDSLPLYFFRYSTIGFWTGGPYLEWYIPSIVLLYLLAPLIKRLVNPQYAWLLTVILLFLIVSSWYLARVQFFADRGHYFCYYRIPAFILGMVCGRLIQHGAGIRPYLTVLFAGIPCFVVFFPQHHAIYEFKYYSLLFLLPAFMLVFCMLSKWMGRWAVIVRRIGEASLEIYLVQTLFFHAIVNGQLSVPDAWHDAITITLILSCSLVGMFLHQVVKRVVR